MPSAQATYLPSDKSMLTYDPVGPVLKTLRLLRPPSLATKLLSSVSKVVLWMLWWRTKTRLVDVFFCHGLLPERFFSQFEGSHVHIYKVTMLRKTIVISCRCFRLYVFTVAGIN
jgi:hypothetical protein